MSREKAVQQRSTANLSEHVSISQCTSEAKTASFEFSGPQGVSENTLGNNEKYLDVSKTLLLESFRNKNDHINDGDSLAKDNIRCDETVSYKKAYDTTKSQFKAFYSQPFLQESDYILMGSLTAPRKSRGLAPEMDSV